MFARRAISRGFGGRGKTTKSDASQITAALREISVNDRVPNDGRGVPSKIPVKRQTRRTVKNFFNKAPSKATEQASRSAKEIGNNVLPVDLPVSEDAEMHQECALETLDTTYAGDAHGYLQSIEAKCCPRAKFLDGAVTAGNRRTLLAWMREVQEFLGLHQETFHLAVTIADLVVENGTVKLHQYQLLGLVGLFIAAKYLERYVPRIDTLMYLASYSYDAQTLIDEEKEVLRIMDYDLNLPTPSWFLEYYTRDDKAAKVRELAGMFLDLFALSAESVAKISPSMRAAASLATANQLCARPSEYWQADLQGKSGYSPAQLELANRRLRVLIDGLYTKERCSLEESIVAAIATRTAA